MVDIVAFIEGQLQTGFAHSGNLAGECGAKVMANLEVGELCLLQLMASEVGISDTQRGPAGVVRSERLDDIPDDTGTLQGEIQHLLRLGEAA